MVQKFFRPYKDINYARSRGDKADDFIKTEFTEGKLYVIDDGLGLMARMTSLKGAIDAYKPEEPIGKPGDCFMTICDKPYKLWSKDKSGKAVATEHQPSVFEKNLCNYLKYEYADAIDGDKSIKGSIAFLPNDQLVGLSDDDLSAQLKHNCQIKLIESSGTLPEYKPPNAGSYRKNGMGKLSPEEKLVWLKKELVGTIADSKFTEETTLSLLVSQMIYENDDNERFLAVYTDFLKAILV